MSDTATQVAQAPVTEQWNGDYPFNTNKYVTRVLNVVFGNSKSSGNPMLTFEWEILSPSAKDIIVGKDQNGKPIRKLMGVAGLTVPFNYISFSEKAMKRTRDWHAKMGIDMPTDEQLASGAIDLEPYKSIVADQIISSEESKVLSDDINPADGTRLPILDENGKPMIRNRLKVDGLVNRNLTFKTDRPF